MLQFSVIDAPSILGLKPTGVETLPEALKNAGLIQGLRAGYAGRVDAPPYKPERDRDTLLLNPYSIKEFSLRLAEKVADVRRKGRFPVVLGGDCSILIGCMLALRRSGKYGLFFIDGHADFYQPEAEPNGEVASMELAIVSGRGPNILTDIDGLKPLVRDEDIIAFGYRDTEEQKEHASQDIRETSINAFSLEQVRALGSDIAAQKALERLQKDQLNGFWIHLDADVLDNAIMPAVDYPLPDGGLQWDELSALLRALMTSGQAVGITITIFNPTLDPSGSIANQFTQSIIMGFS
ncbi:Arginase/agmatinase/formiminoglutamase [Methanosarcina horonobensis HB-1 = JCM 15518]|uniref:Arginase/agmatinase/formiminoglutamase n=1 Tax=Methanosarcina horonobensis HB-1 = JCM 15518 TaxID=1434110 RepID=A0A0E3S7N3_9EURY|nr:arginase family protein [Methanosarcina horonobensis]AKB77409.1 Arginase/agmatinase/formiminoglutamase [Methanosarcina horonobensis HB-1 = JCM 15518]